MFIHGNYIMYTMLVYACYSSCTMDYSVCILFVTDCLLEFSEKVRKSDNCFETFKR